MVLVFGMLPFSVGILSLIQIPTKKANKTALRSGPEIQEESISRFYFVSLRLSCGDFSDLQPRIQVRSSPIDQARASIEMKYKIIDREDVYHLKV
jgi:hypothetical protein